MKPYKQLTLEQRYEIQILCAQGKRQKEIAATIGAHKSGISREIKRNSAGGKYEAQEAQIRYGYKKRRRTAYKLTESVKADIVRGLQQDLSPEQIVGQAALAQTPMVSHETIYSFVYSRQKKYRSDKSSEGSSDITWWQSCLRRRQKKRQKRKNLHQNRSLLEQPPAKEAKVSIEARPDLINARTRIGDCEIDTIIGKDHKGAILTVVERLTKHASIVKLPNKSDQAVAEALKELAGRQAPFQITSLTSDNGTEFAAYADIKKALGCDFFFAHPYSSWERGLNENTNGLIRQYIPKKTSFDLYDEPCIRNIEEKLNNRPRKTLGFYSPLQILEAKKHLITCCT